MAQDSPREPREELIPGWEIVEQKTSPAPGIFAVLLNYLAVAPMPPLLLGSVSYTLRNAATGDIKMLHANSKEEAQILAIQGKFSEAVIRA